MSVGAKRRGTELSPGQQACFARTRGPRPRLPKDFRLDRNEMAVADIR